jgi:hypothetical protein
MYETIILYTAIIGMLAIWSHMYWRQNPIYRLFEHVIIGVQMGLVIITTIGNLRGNMVYPVLEGQWEYLIPMTAGVLVLTQLTRQYAWMARIGMGMILGAGVGTDVYGVVAADVISLTKSTIGTPLIVSGDPVLTASRIINIILYVGTVCYFVFGREQTGIWGRITQIGRYAIMVCYGVAWGSIYFIRQATTDAAVINFLERIGLSPF